MQVQSGGADPRDAEEAAAAQTGTSGLEVAHYGEIRGDRYV